MEIFTNHKALYGTATLLFLSLTFFVAILPAINNQEVYKPLPGSHPLTFEQLEGKKIYIANGCVGCHTQQVRNIVMDKVWGSRPGVAADYALNSRMSTWINTATLMGTERTGPDLTNVGNRQPGIEWHLLHLYQPRSVVAASIMPAYPWLFKSTPRPSVDDVVVNVPVTYLNNSGEKIVATKKALYLVAYLQTLKQIPLPDGSIAQDFLYKKLKKDEQGSNDELPDGAALYASNCLSCHQENGEGLSGAFPPLKASKIVNSDDIELMVTIIMQGYDAREEFAVMPAVGINNNLSPEDVAAIMNHEKTSWGNNSKKVTAAQVKEIIDKLKPFR